MLSLAYWMLFCKPMAYKQCSCSVQVSVGDVCEGFLLICSLSLLPGLKPSLNLCLYHSMIIEERSLDVSPLDFASMRQSFCMAWKPSK